MGQFRMIIFLRIYRPIGQEATFSLTYTSTISHENVYADAKKKEVQVKKCTISPLSPSLFTPKFEWIDCIIPFLLYTFARNAKLTMWHQKAIALYSLLIYLIRSRNSNSGILLPSTYFLFTASPHFQTHTFYSYTH